MLSLIHVQNVFSGKKPTMSRRSSRASQARTFSANRTQTNLLSRGTAMGQQYPEIRQRGFYSDIICNEVSLGDVSAVGVSL